MLQTQKQIKAMVFGLLETNFSAEGNIIKADSIGMLDYHIEKAQNEIQPLLKLASGPDNVITKEEYDRLSPLKQKAIRKLKELKNEIYGIKLDIHTSTRGQLADVRIDTSASPSGRRETIPSTREVLLSIEQKKSIQRFLNTIPGVYVGTDDGIFGSKTRTGIRVFQFRNGLEENGRVDKATYDKMMQDMGNGISNPASGREESGDGTPRTVEVSENLNKVPLTKAQKFDIQLYLNQSGIKVGKEDGVIGKNTRAGIKKYQGSKGLNQTGEIDQATLDRLNQDMGINKPSKETNQSQVEEGVSKTSKKQEKGSNPFLNPDGGIEYASVKDPEPSNIPNRPTSLELFGAGNPDVDPRATQGIRTKPEEEIHNRQGGERTLEVRGDWDMTDTMGTPQDLEGVKGKINMQSFEKMIRAMSLSELKAFSDKIWSIAETNNTKTGNRFKFTPANIGELKKVFESKGYKADKSLFDWGLGGEEMAALFRIINNITQTQENLPKLDFKEKLAIVIDHSSDGYLDGENNITFFTGEEELFKAIKTEKDFDNLLRNLWYENGIQSFDQAFADNYYAARQEFKARLGTLLNVPDAYLVNPSDMIMNPDAVKNRMEQLEVARIAAEKAVENHPKFRSLPQELKEEFKLKAVTGIIGSVRGIGFLFSTGVNIGAQIGAITVDVLNTAGFTVANGAPGFYLNVIDVDVANGRLKVNAGLANFIPVGGASLQVIKANIGKIESLFPNKLKDGYVITLLGGWSPLGHSLGVDINRVDEKNMEGISQAKEKMGAVLDKLFSDIKLGKTFEDSSFNSNNPDDKKTYKRISDGYRHSGGNETAIMMLKIGTLNEYERALFEGSEGINVSGSTFGLAFVAGFLPIPLVGLHGEIHSKVNWKRRSGAEITRETGVDGYYESISGLDGEFKVEAVSLDSSFSSSTRGNEAVYDLLLPGNDLNKRWKALKTLSKTDPKLKKSVLGNLIDQVDGMTGKEQENHKLYLLSIAIGGAKKAGRFGGDWNVDTVRKANEYSQLGNTFSSLLGVDLKDEAEQFRKILISKQGNIGTGRINSLVFDAAATKDIGRRRRKVSGVDRLDTSKVFIIDGKPLMVPINNNKISGFIGKIDGMTSISEGTKEALKKGLRNGTIELAFVRDPDGYDFRVVPIVKGSSRPGMKLYSHKMESTNWGILWVGPIIKEKEREEEQGEDKDEGKEEDKSEDKDEDKSEDKDEDKGEGKTPPPPGTTPGEEPGLPPPPDTTPGQQQATTGVDTNPGNGQALNSGVSDSTPLTPTTETTGRGGDTLTVTLDTAIVEPPLPVIDEIESPISQGTTGR